MSKDHIIVVRRSESELRLTGARCRVTAQEFEPEEFAFKYQWNFAKALPLKVTGIEQVVEMARELNPHKQ